MPVPELDDHFMTNFNPTLRNVSPQSKVLLRVILSYGNLEIIHTNKFTLQLISFNLLVRCRFATLKTQWPVII